MPKPKRFSDESEMAKSILDEIIEETERPDFGQTQSAKVTAARQKGGKARATALTPKRRKEIAQKAAASRWKSEKK